MVFVELVEVGFVVWLAVSEVKLFISRGMSEEW